MKSVFAFLLLIITSPAYAQVGIPWPGPGVVASGGGGGGYVGPCDTSVAGGGGCSLFYGLRAATAAYAASLGALIDWNCTGGHSGTLHSDSAGDANATELGTIASDCGANDVFVPKVYEPISGTAFAVAGTVGLRFFNDSSICKGLARCLYSLATFGDYDKVTASVTIAQPWTVSTVKCRIGETTTQFWVLVKNSAWAIGNSTSTNTAALYAGSSVVTATENDCASSSVPHSTQYIGNGASSAIVVDGTATTGLSPGTASLTNDYGIGNDATGSSSPYNGAIAEIAVYPIALAAGSGAGQYGKVCNNQRTYWGTGGSC